MSEREEAGLRRLKRDLDEADWPTPELLARYATEPNRLSELEKQAVERALAASPLVADELATLRGFDFARLDADRRPATVGAGLPADGGLLSTTGLARRLRAWLAGPAVWVATAALLALGFWLAQSLRGNAPTIPDAPPPQLVERATDPGPQAVPDASVVGDREEAIAEAPSRAPAESPDDSPAESPTSDPSRLAAQEAPSPAPAPKAEILLAMAMPDYRPAYGVESMTGSEWIVRGGDDAPARIRVLAPDHVTRACGPKPVLHWSLDRVPATGAFFLSIVDERDEPVVLDLELPRPNHGGLQKIDLETLGVALPSSGTLRWSVALREDESSAPTTFDFGWLRVEAPDTAAAAGLAARGELGQAAGLAELGCYAEALEAALRMRASRPGDPEPAKAVAKLARQAGFDPALADE